MTPGPDNTPEVFSPIIELRRYTMRPGKRDVLIAMFDGGFVDAQEAVGMQIIGQFRDIDDPNKFVWMRGFPSMPDRARALSAFYDGPHWKSRRDAANATIIDNDNVLLLRPVGRNSGLVLNSGERPACDAAGDGNGVVIMSIYHIDPTADKEKEFVDFFDGTVRPMLESAGAGRIAAFVHEQSANTFPRLPIRDGEPVFVWLSVFASLAAFDQFTATLNRSPEWHDAVALELSARVREPCTLRLLPTARSLLHG